MHRAVQYAVDGDEVRNFLRIVKEGVLSPEAELATRAISLRNGFGASPSVTVLLEKKQVQIAH